MSFVAKGKERNVQNQDKQTPHTVLQKLSPNQSHTTLKVVQFFKILNIYTLWYWLFSLNFWFTYMYWFDQSQVSEQICIFVTINEEFIIIILILWDMQTCSLTRMPTSDHSIFQVLACERFHSVCFLEILNSQRVHTCTSLTLWTERRVESFALQWLSLFILCINSLNSGSAKNLRYFNEQVCIIQKWKLI